MKLLRLLCIFLLAWAVPATVASANQDDGILEHLSGPGPFARWLSFNVRALCITNVNGQNHTVGLTPWARGSTSEFGVKAHKDSPTASADQNTASDNCSKDKDVRGYVTVAWGKYFSLENNLFPSSPTDKRFKVKADSVSVRFMGRTVGDVVDVGVGVNIFWFHGDAFDTFARASVEPFRISVAPFAALKSSPRTRAFRVGVAPTIFIGTMDQGDFCTTGRCAGIPRAFSTRGEIVWATTVEVDVLTLGWGK